MKNGFWLRLYRTKGRDEPRGERDEEGLRPRLQGPGSRLEDAEAGVQRAAGLLLPRYQKGVYLLL